MIISREEWSKVKEQGKVKYILINWVLLAAFPVAIFMSIARWLIKKVAENYFLSSDFFKNLLMYIALCTVISVLLGLRKWNKYNKFFKPEA
ncbi:MAG: hypothetical protein K0R31_1396 [Clostridiales bacterium]|jgi:glucose-6-phosphate-specific signal transduction histidine kinase|nr:hypothetical protein [Clostridiales bacterium]